MMLSRQQILRRQAANADPQATFVIRPTRGRSAAKEILSDFGQASEFTTNKTSKSDDSTGRKQ
jgi:hypothetical protein